MNESDKKKILEEQKKIKILEEDYVDFMREGRYTAGKKSTLEFARYIEKQTEKRVATDFNTMIENRRKKEQEFLKECDVAEDRVTFCYVISKLLEMEAKIKKKYLDDPKRSVGSDVKPLRSFHNKNNKKEGDEK